LLHSCCTALHEYGAERVRQGPSGVEGRCSCWPANPLQIDGFLGLKAEGEGFEPSVDRKAHNGFRDRAESGGLQGGSTARAPVRARRPHQPGVGPRARSFRGAALIAVRQADFRADEAVLRPDGRRAFPDAPP
jgi:hypothetical protein